MCQSEVLPLRHVFRMWDLAMPNVNHPVLHNFLAHLVAIFLILVRLVFVLPLYLEMAVYPLESKHLVFRRVLIGLLLATDATNMLRIIMVHTNLESFCRCVFLLFNRF